MRRHVGGWVVLVSGLVVLCLLDGLMASAGVQPSLTVTPNQTTFHVGETISVSTVDPICQGGATPGGQVQLVKGASDPVLGVPDNLPVVLTVAAATNPAGVLTATLRLPEAGTFQIEAKCADFPSFVSILPTQIIVLAAAAPPAAVPTRPALTG